MAVFGIKKQLILFTRKNVRGWKIRRFPHCKIENTIEVVEDNDQITAALNEAANPNPANDVLHGMEASVQCHLGFVLAKWSFREA